MKQIFQSIITVITILLITADVNAQVNIITGEYFFDNDPGYGNGTAIPVATPSQNLVSLAVNANVASLAYGMHTLFIRTKDANGKWSMSYDAFIAKVQAPLPNTNTVGNIDKLEYFYDTDPGFGSGTDIPVASPAINLTNFIFNADVSTVSYGMHTLYIRARDVNGKWSMSNAYVFAKVQPMSGNPNTITNINKMEYFYDADPGFGSGTDIPVTSAANLNGFVVNADVSSLSYGLHILHIRSRDTTGKWSMTNAYSFAKIQLPLPNPDTISNIVQAEYFYDNDPGFGNGTSIPTLTGSANFLNASFNADVSALSNGVHTLFVRTKDSSQKWSISNRLMFAKIQTLLPNPNTISNITNVEYFLDTDPGFGNGTPVTITPAMDISNISFNVDLTYVVSGAHELFVRTKDAQGKWSITNIHVFNGGIIPTPIKLVSFDAILQKDNTVLLQWITDLEANVKSYVIEKSTDAAQWIWVANKNPLSPNSNERRTYNLLDEHPGTGIIYYRLTELDINGEKTTAPIRFVRINNVSEFATVVYPNPNDGKRVNIQSDLFKDKKVELAIIAADGKLYRKQTVSLTGKSLITLSDLNLPSGTYFINLTTESEAQTVKLIVETKDL